MRNQKGFTLIELLIVVAIIGIIAAIAIPNLLNAIQRGKQKRTMGDMRTIATAVEEYAIDNNAFVVMSAGCVSGLRSHMEPTFIKKLPVNDGWNNCIQYSASDGTEYTVTSYGKDRATSGPSGGPTTDFRHDLLFSSGSFISWPDGAQN